ncbi:isoprenylcysteine carboxylmethyltransferase family protein [Niveibacterium sp.]|uniref:methyltransferase family protein n=1 Tax=Niveibacterium sp. TaxID=2017444 RepID=UPI0035B42FD9
MSTSNVSDYGLWGLVILNIVIFVAFAYSFFKPQTRTDWRTLGSFSAFVVALFVEMYGVPLTMYLLAGWLQTRYPGLNPLSHEAGHLWWSVLGLKGDPHFNIIHIASMVAIVVGMFMLSSAWPVLYRAQRAGEIAREGLYARCRHPQYLGFIVIMAGFLLQWPTLLTLLMFPLLVWRFVRLARDEEREARQHFGARWDAYSARTPAWIPRLGT